MQHGNIGPVMITLAFAALPAAAMGQNVPVQLGVDDAGSYHWWKLSKPAWEYPAWFKALDELGAELVSIHFWPVSDASERNSAETRKRLEALDTAMREHRVRYTLNVELSNWLPRLEITPGVNEFEHPGDVHRWDLRMEWLSAVLPPARPVPSALTAITYDECEHMLLSNNKFSNSPENTFDKPYLVSTHGLDLAAAFDNLVAEARRIRVEHYGEKVMVQTEQVWPDLFHVFARAGWTITPKLLKENISPVVMSIALGAAIQYQDTGARFWVSPDLWNYGAYPGHSPQALRSALLMGYWLGAEAIYVENLDFHEWAQRHPQAAPNGSLVCWASPDQFELTPHGRVVHNFYKNYVPANPRTVDWRDYDPRVAIIRLPDGAWGQNDREPAEVESRNRLLGNRDMPVDEPAGEWLEVWPLLTHGKVRPGAISSANRRVYPKGFEDLFFPIDSVAVFDHLVTAEQLKNVECLVVCGHALSETSFRAIRERVAGGATCIISQRLYDRHADAKLPGDWLVLDDFKDPRLGQALARFLGPPDVARFRFKRQVVEFRQGPEPDSITVRVLDRDR